MNTIAENNAPAREAVITIRALAPEQAFVVHFCAPEGLNQPPSAGRVAHVSSGRAGRFESWPELIEFVTRVLAVNRNLKNAVETGGLGKEE